MTYFDAEHYAGLQIWRDQEPGSPAGGSVFNPLQFQVRGSTSFVGDTFGCGLEDPFTHVSTTVQCPLEGTFYHTEDATRSDFMFPFHVAPYGRTFPVPGHNYNLDHSYTFESESGIPGMLLSIVDVIEPPDYVQVGAAVSFTERQPYSSVCAVDGSRPNGCGPTTLGHPAINFLAPSPLIFIPDGPPASADDIPYSVSGWFHRDTGAIPDPDFLDPDNTANDLLFPFDSLSGATIEFTAATNDHAATLGWIFNMTFFWLNAPDRPGTMNLGAINRGVRARNRVVGRTITP